MSENNKTARNIAIIVAGIFFICALCGLTAYLFSQFVNRALGDAFSADPTEAAVRAQAIVAHDVPDGYVYGMALSLLGNNLVAIGPAQGEGMIFMLLQIPSSSQSDSEDYQEQMRRTLSQQSGQMTGENGEQYQFEQVEEKTYTIRGQEVIMAVSEGRSQESGAVLRQMVGIFDGPVGPVMLMVSGEPENWDEDIITTFFGSIR